VVYPEQNLNKFHKENKEKKLDSKIKTVSENSNE